MLSCFRPGGSRAHRELDKHSKDVNQVEAGTSKPGTQKKGKKAGIGAVRHPEAQKRESRGSPRFFRLSLSRRKKHISLDPLDRPASLPPLVPDGYQTGGTPSQESTEQSLSGQSSNAGPNRASSSSSSPSWLLSYGNAPQDATPTHLRHRGTSLPPSVDRSVDNSTPSVTSGQHEATSVSSRTELLTPTASATLHTSPTPVTSAATRLPPALSPLHRAHTSPAVAAAPPAHSVYSFSSSVHSHDADACVATASEHTPPIPSSPSPHYMTPMATMPPPPGETPRLLPASLSPEATNPLPSATSPPVLQLSHLASTNSASPPRPAHSFSRELSTPSSLPLPSSTMRRHFTATAETMTHVVNPVFSPPRSVQHRRVLGMALPSPRSLPARALLQYPPPSPPSGSPTLQLPSVAAVDADAEAEGAALDAVTSTAQDGSIELDFSLSPVPSVTPRGVPRLPQCGPASPAPEGRLSIPVAAPFTTPAAGTTIAGRFLIRRFVGATPFAQVFAANDLEAGSVPCSVRLPAPGAPAAAALIELGRLQWLRTAVAAPTGAAAFARVLSMPALLGHGSLVAIESLEESAPARLRRIAGGGTRPFSAWDLKCIARQLLQGAAHLHSSGIVHGDLSPHSVFFKATAGTQLRLVDIGCGAFPVFATAAAPAPAPRGSTAAEVQNAQAAAAAARRTCSAPELLCVPPVVSDKADVYAIGCILFYMATGRHLHRRKSLAEDLTPRTTMSAGRVGSVVSPARSSAPYSATMSPGSLESASMLSPAAVSPAARIARGPASLPAMVYGRSQVAQSDDGLPPQSTAARILECPDIWAHASMHCSAALQQGGVAEGTVPGSGAWVGALPRLPSQAVGEGRLRSLGSCSIGSETPQNAGADAGPVARGWAGVMARASLRKPRGGRSSEQLGPEGPSMDDVMSDLGVREAGPLYLVEQMRGPGTGADERMQRRLRRLAATPIAYLLRDLLWEEPTARPTAQEALQHPFFFGAHSM